MTLTDELRRHLRALDHAFKGAVRICDQIDEERELVRQLLCRVDPEGAAWAIDRGDGIEDVDDEGSAGVAPDDSSDQATWTPSGRQVADLLPPPATAAPCAAVVEAVMKAEAEVRTYACPICGKAFGSRQALGGHTSRGHSPDEKTAAGMPTNTPAAPTERTGPQVVADRGPVMHPAEHGKVIACESCDWETGPSRASDLVKHTVWVHGRRPTKTERTPVPASAVA